MPCTHDCEPAAIGLELLPSRAEPEVMLMIGTAARWMAAVIGTALLVGAIMGGSLRMGAPFEPTHLASLVVGSAALGAAVAGRRVLPAYGAGTVLLTNTILLLA